MRIINSETHSHSRTTRLNKAKKKLFEFFSRSIQYYVLYKQKDNLMSYLPQDRQDSNLTLRSNALSCNIMALTTLTIS